MFGVCVVIPLATVFTVIIVAAQRKGMISRKVAAVIFGVMWLPIAAASASELWMLAAGCPRADPDAERSYHAPRKAMMATYLDTLTRLKLDGYVYPAIQMPPPDESMPQDGALSGGPHSATSWINMLGAPAIVVPAGFYPSGLPFGLEFSSRPWTDGDLLGIAYAWEQATHLRKSPTLVDNGLLATTPARERLKPPRP